MIAEVDELLDIGRKLNIKIELLTDETAEKYINKVLDLFKPFKLTGHLGIGHDSFHIPIDEWEFSYMEYLCQEAGYIFLNRTKF